MCESIAASPIGDADLAAWQAEIALQQFQTEIGVHFTAVYRTRSLFPAARKFPELELPWSRNSCSTTSCCATFFAKAEAHKMLATDLVWRSLACCMSTHIRKEERQLFERLQELMNPEELALLRPKSGSMHGRDKDAAQACILPTDATRPRSDQSDAAKVNRENKRQEPKTK